MWERKQTSRSRKHQRVPNKINPKRTIPRHTVIKMAKIKDKKRILKAVREKQQVTYKGTPVRLSTDFSEETLKARREWHRRHCFGKQPRCSPYLLQVIINPSLSQKKKRGGVA